MKQRILSLLLMTSIFWGLLSACGTQPSAESPPPQSSNNSSQETNPPQPSQSPSAPLQQESDPPVTTDSPSVPPQGSGSAPETSEPQPSQDPSDPPQQESVPPAAGEEPSAPPQSAGDPVPETSGSQPSQDPSDPPQQESVPPTAGEEPSAPPQSSEETSPEPEPSVVIKEFTSTLDPSVFGRERIWRFTADIVNDTGSALTMTSLCIDRCKGEKVIHQFITTGSNLADRFQTRLEPGKTFQYQDSCPAEDTYDRMVYTFTYCDSQGREIQYRFIFHVTMNIPGPVDIGKDNTEGHPVVYPKDSSFGVRWEFGMRIENKTDSSLSIKEVTRIRRFGGKNGSVVEKNVFSPSQLPNGGLSPISPGKSAVYQDNSPVSAYYDFVQYTLVFVNEQGKEVEYVYHFYASQDSAPPSSSSSSGGNSNEHLQRVDISKDNDHGYPVVKPSDGSWIFSITVTNESDTLLKLNQIKVVRRMGGKNGTETETVILDKSVISAWNIAELKPGASASWEDHSPSIKSFDFVSYIHEYVDEQGAKVELTFHFYVSE